MKRSATLLALLSFVLGPLAFPQGSLTPPGAPGMTMKTLDQIEARTPISSLPYPISSPGSYYLTSDLFTTSGDAITINVSGVTLDLNGFTISSGANPASGSAVLVTANSADITIGNGHIKGGVTYDGNTYSGNGFVNGIQAAGFTYNVHVTNVSVSGCLNYGIHIGGGDSTLVDSCAIRTVGGDGIVAAQVSRCVAVGCGTSGITASIAESSFGQANNGRGVYVAQSANNCYGQSNTSDGLYTFGAVNNCYGFTYSSAMYSAGLYAASASNSYGWNNGPGYGLYARSANNCFGFGAGGGYGLYASIGNNSGGSSNNGVAIFVIDGGTLIGCSASTSSIGISSGTNCTIQNCAAIFNTSHGITVGDASLVSNCTSQSNGGDGIRVTQYCQVIGNTANDNGAPNDATKAGIHMTGGANRIESNHAVGNKFRGILIDAAGGFNLVIKNSARDNVGANFDLTGAGNTNYGQIIANPGANFINSNPWANFAF